MSFWAGNRQPDLATLPPFLSISEKTLLVGFDPCHVLENIFIGRPITLAQTRLILTLADIVFIYLIQSV